MNEIWAAFDNLDPEGRALLNTIGSIASLGSANHRLLAPGLNVILVSDKFRVPGTLEFVEHDWRARFDWKDAEELTPSDRERLTRELFIGFGTDFAKRHQLNARIVGDQNADPQTYEKDSSLPLEVYADFQHCDVEGRAYLSCIGTINDLWAAGMKLRPGLKLMLTSDEFRVLGIVEYSRSEHTWTARFNWDDLTEINPQL